MNNHIRKLFSAVKLQLAILVALSSTYTYAEQVIDISATQLVSMQSAPKSEPFVVLDVRSAEEFSQGHIPGAINISHDILADNLEKLANYEHQKIIVHCRSGKRAALALDVLEANNFTQLRHLAGDMNGWRDSNLAIIK